MLWDGTATPANAKRLVEGLDAHFPESNVSNIALTPSAGLACLHFSVDFACYARATLAQVETDVQRSGGRFIELLRIPEEKRDSFRAQFLMPPRGSEPMAFSNFKQAAESLRGHLSKLGSSSSAPAAPIPPTCERTIRIRGPTVSEVQRPPASGVLHRS